MKFLTDAELKRFETASLELVRIQCLINDQRAEMIEVANAAFLRFLQEGRFHIHFRDDDYYSLTPKDANTDRDMSKLVMETFNLGWHDDFSIYGKGFYIEGRVDDGRMTLYLHIHTEPSQESLKALKLDFDFGELLRSQVEKSLEDAEQNLIEAEKERDKRRAQLEKLK